MSSDAADLAALAGRAGSARADAQRTRERLVEAVDGWVAEHGSPPARLADVAERAGVSTATAYRHFSSVDDVIRAFVLQLPIRTVELFDEAGGRGGDPVDAFARWNLAWVRACEEHGALAVHLRSPRGFLERRENDEPVIAYACSQIEPLLDRLADDAGRDTTMMLFMWNVTSDPREVLDLRRLGWSVERIADFVTRAVLATPPC
ncbi:MAG: TetR/AcrR family transcriptional regulator [Ilumatobacter sp.]